MKYFLIYNPTARQGKSKKDFDKAISIFEKRNVDFEYIFTSEKDEAINLAKNAANEKYDVVVPVGGDGTICEVITGLMHQPSEKRPNLGILHIGTSPDFNRCHNLPIKLEEAVDVLLNGKTEKIDIGKVSHLDLNKQEIISYFGSNVNIGLGPNIASRSNGRYRKYLGDFLGTLSSTIVSLTKFKKISLKLEIDNKEEELSNLINLTIGKDPYIASGMRVFSEIQPTDGRLYILSIQDPSKISLLKNLWRMYSGDILDYPGANLSYCKEVKIKRNEECFDDFTIEFDGDFRGYLPAKIEVMSKALELIIK